MGGISTNRVRFSSVVTSERLTMERPIPPYDVRLKRELAHRRLVVSMTRRLLRVLSLHLLDGTLVVAVVYLLSNLLANPGAKVLAPAIGAVFVLSINAVGAYSSGNARRVGLRLLTGIVIAVLILTAFSLTPPNLPLDLRFLGALGVVGFAALATGRAVADQVVRQAYVRGIGLRRAVVVGNLEEVAHAIQQLRDDQNIDQYIVGHLAPNLQPDPTALGVLRELPRLLDELDVQEVVLATSLSPQMVRWVADCCFERGTVLYVFPSVLGEVDCRVEPLRVGACALLHLAPSRLEVPALLVKRGFDLIVAAVALILLAPLLALIAIAIKLDSPGPIFFRQARVGLGGRIFTIWKFRSMGTDSEDRKHELAARNAHSDRRLFKMRDDPRVTRVGRILRRSSLDEIPQLFNVILGDMSLVGPRPPLPSEVEAYEAHDFDRLMVVPGITGPWQVGGRNLITDFEKVVRMERAYIQSWSFWLDLQILMRTVKVVWRGEGQIE